VGAALLEGADFAPISGLRSPREPHRVSGFRSPLDCGAAARSSTDRLAWLSSAGDDKPATATISASTITASTTNCVDHPAPARPWHRGAADVLHVDGSVVALTVVVAYDISENGRLRRVYRR